MPVTPFHFGPGLLAKSVWPTGFSFSSYCATQVAIDLESGYHLLLRDPPIHRSMHTFLVGGLVGVGVGALVSWLGTGHAPGWRHHELAVVRSELSVAGSLLGGLVGGWGHALLDGIMHHDVGPFMPFSAANPLLGIISVSTLHAVCVVSGLLGAVVLGVRRSLWSATARQPR